MICWLCFRYDIISTHAPAGGATAACRGHSRPAEHFYSRPCGRGDWLAGQMGLPVEKFLLTPLREGRRQPAGGTPDRRNISTHAPAGGATSKTECVHQARNISTHAPAGGATISNGSRSWPRRFLLTPLREGRLNRIVIALMQELISTHAPAGGATADLRRCWKHRPHFYSRPCGRGDQMSGLRFESMAISTHAPAGGATRRRDNRKGAYTIFLLTPLREGRRRMAKYVTKAQLISTHAPAGGATG